MIALGAGRVFWVPGDEATTGRRGGARVWKRGARVLGPGPPPARRCAHVGRLREQGPAAPSKLLIKAGGRLFLVDQKDICYASIEDGIITVATTIGEGQSNCRTLEELLASLDPNLFWRAHRSYLVNINRIREVVPWFKSSYQLRMDDKKQAEVPVSRAQTKRLRELFRL